MIPRSEVTRLVKAVGGFDRVHHAEVRAGFADQWWTYDNHLYLEPVCLTERASALAERLAERKRMLISHAEVCNLLDGRDARHDEAGWWSGQFFEIVRDQFAEMGWKTESIQRGGITRTIHVYPLDDVMEDHYSRGIFPLPTKDLVGFYVGISAEPSVDDRSRKRFA